MYRYHKFMYDRVFEPGCDQETIYREVGEQTVVEVLNGYNGTIFAFGQTGSGKSYTMFGEQTSCATEREIGVKSGLIPRAVQDLFRMIGEAKTLRVDEEFQEKMPTKPNLKSPKPELDISSGEMLLFGDL